MGLTKFLKQQLDGELSVEQLKGTESLVDVKDRGDPTAVAPLPKKLARREEKREKAGKGEQKKVAAAEVVRCELAERMSEAPSVVPYSAEDKVLVLGDGDFSFSHAVVSSFKPDLARKLVATVFDSSKERHAKYGLPSHRCEYKAEGSTLQCAAFLYIHTGDFTYKGNFQFRLFSTKGNAPKSEGFLRQLHTGWFTGPKARASTIKPPKRPALHHLGKQSNAFVLLCLSVVCGSSPSRRGVRDRGDCQ